MKKVSIILPVYNVEKYLRKCLDSIINQTFDDFEVICINDGSTDNSLEILNEYAQKDSRFIIISQENQGQGVARNKGIEISQGEYIQFVDPDDWIELNMLEKLYDFAKKHQSQVVKFNYTEYNDYSGQYKKVNFTKRIKKDYNYDLDKKSYYNWRSLKKDCLSNIELHAWSHFYLAEFIKSHNIQFAPSKHGEDHLFADGAFLLAEKIDYLSEYFYLYRIRSGSCVRLKSDINLCVFDNIQLLKDFLITNNLFEELEEEWNEYAKKIIICHYSKIPEASIRKYEDLSKQYFTSEKEYLIYKKKMLQKKSFLKQIFSIQNEYRGAIKYKSLTILGIKFYLKSKKKSLV